MRPRWWDRLSDGELRARLVQRGAGDPLADAAVQGRDHDEVTRDVIHLWLGPE